jgi:DNA polymerase III sliding clamp (beta) subunit (PCNA family)
MLTSLKFVQGAIARKDLLPALTHFRIEKGTVRGYNGTLALCSPIPLDIECTPKAEPLVKAIGNCEETVQLSLTPTGKLSVRSGAFKAFVECVEGDTPHVEPEGELFDVDGIALLAAFKHIWPFIGNDASRPWSNGVLLRGESAFATNNVSLVEYWLGTTFPKVANVPRAAIKEMLRINEPPTSAQITETSITFHYGASCWIRSQLFAVDWPDLGKVLDRPSNMLPMDDRLFAALKKVKPFVDKNGRIFIGDGKVFTHRDEIDGASYEIPEMQWDGVYNIEILASLEGVATAIDWSSYPSPCIFSGDRLRGAIIGMRFEEA